MKLQLPVKEAIEALDHVHEKANLSLREYMTVRDSIQSGSRKRDSFWSIYDDWSSNILDEHNDPGTQWMMSRSVALMVLLVLRDHYFTADYDEATHVTDIFLREDVSSRDNIRDASRALQSVATTEAAMAYNYLTRS